LSEQDFMGLTLFLHKRLFPGLEPVTFHESYIMHITHKSAVCCFITDLQSWMDKCLPSAKLV